VKWLLLMLLAGVALLLWRLGTYAKRHLPRAGSVAPEFSLPDVRGRMRSSGEFLDRWLVLYFFPRADTPG
jgi:thioredoxin-dependent peroxiredoxin